jgi:hypothetical protein
MWIADGKIASEAGRKQFSVESRIRTSWVIIYGKKKKYFNRGVKNGARELTVGIKTFQT